MRYSKQDLRAILQRTNGRCHLCYTPHTLATYGSAWHVEHSKPRAEGGTNHGRNLLVACARCNLQKGTRTTRTERAKNGFTRRPKSTAQVEAERAKNKDNGQLAGCLTGGALGFSVAGPVGAFVGFVTGGLAGSAIGEDWEIEP